MLKWSINRITNPNHTWQYDNALNRPPPLHAIYYPIYLSQSTEQCSWGGYWVVFGKCPFTILAGMLNTLRCFVVFLSPSWEILGYASVRLRPLPSHLSFISHHFGCRYETCRHRRKIWSKDRRFGENTLWYLMAAWLTLGRNVGKILPDHTASRPGW
jgi:hypothetical protein